MKLESLEIKNFQKVREASLDLSTATIHYFCGANEAGKSTIKDAVRFVLLGDSARVPLKKNYKQLLSDGAKGGHIRLQFDGIQLERSVVTGESKNKHVESLPEAARTAARIAFGAQGFTEMDPDKRRQMLFALMQAKTDPEAIAEKMAKRGIPEPVIKRLKVLLKGSVEAAHTSAKGEVSSCRAKWEQATGERFGTEKAKGWTATAPLAPPTVKTAADDVEGLRKDVADLDAKLLESAREIGAAEAQVKLREQRQAELERLDNFVHNSPTLQRELATLEKELGEAQEELKVANELIERAAEATHVMTCPGCDAHVQKDADGELIFADPNAQNYAVDEEGRVALLARRDAAQAVINHHSPEIAKTRSRLDAVARNSELRQSIETQLGTLATPEKLAELKAADEVVKQERADFREQLRQVETYLRQVEEAEKATAAAAQLLEQFHDWKKAEDALAPDGIPAEILAEALGDFNRRMLTSAHLAGWRAPVLTKDMEIVREGDDTEAERPYPLLSVSAQWRVSAIVADAISSIAGIRVLVLDGWDVLDLPGRVQLLKWLNALAETDYDTILAMATLKEPLKADLAGPNAAVHWVEQGEVT